MVLHGWRAAFASAIEVDLQGMPQSALARGLPRRADAAEAKRAGGTELPGLAVVLQVVFATLFPFRQSFQAVSRCDLG